MRLENWTAIQKIFFKFLSERLEEVPKIREDAAKEELSRAQQQELDTKLAAMSLQLQKCMAEVNATGTEMEDTESLSADNISEVNKRVLASYGLDLMCHLEIEDAVKMRDLLHSSQGVDVEVEVILDWAKKRVPCGEDPEIPETLDSHPLTFPAYPSDWVTLDDQELAATAWSFRSFLNCCKHWPFSVRCVILVASGLAMLTFAASISIHVPIALGRCVLRFLDVSDEFDLVNLLIGLLILWGISRAWNRIKYHCIGNIN